MSSCFRCDGSGLICDVCGESKIACTCEADGGEEPQYSDCQDCDGSGTESDEDGLDLDDDSDFIEDDE